MSVDNRSHHLFLSLCVFYIVLFYLLLLIIYYYHLLLLLGQRRRLWLARVSMGNATTETQEGSECSQIEAPTVHETAQTNRSFHVA